MATFGLPDKAWLSPEVQAMLPADYDGVSAEPYLAQIFESFTESHVVSGKLRNILSMSQNMDQFFGGLAETFPESGAKEHDFWSLNIDSLGDVLFWFRMFQKFGNILDNGTYLSIKNALDVGRKSFSDPAMYLDESVLARSFAFVKFLRDEGSYAAVSDTYFFLSHVDDEEALKLLASGLTVEEYKNYCALECYTYSEIFEGHVSELPDEWKDFLFGQLVEERSEGGEG